MEAEPEPAWQDDAACRHPDIDPAMFFPHRGADAAPAKEICRACPVRSTCLDYALDNGEKFCIWGGTSERERRHLRRSRRADRGAA